MKFLFGAKRPKASASPMHPLSAPDARAVAGGPAAGAVLALSRAPMRKLSQCELRRIVGGPTGNPTLGSGHQ